jgi:flagellar capping protein FliD
VSAEPLETRIARMEGVNVQIADRLNGIDRRLDSLDGRLDSLRSDMNARFTQVDGRFAQIDGRFSQMDQKFMWVIGINVTSWTTVMTVLLAVFFRH